MLLAVCSLKGSPGATTAALALGTCWPGDRRTVVVECDPAGGDLAARFRLPGAPGLVSLAAAGRGSSDASVLWQQVQRLAGDVAVVPGPVGAEQARAALGIVGSRRGSVLRSAGDQPGVVVVADCGRVDPDSPALPVIRAADAMLLLARARDEALAHVAGKLRAAATWNPNPGLVLVGDGYSTGEIEHELGVGVLGRIPHDPRGAAVLCGRRRRSPAPEQSVLGRAAVRISVSITQGRRTAPPTQAPTAVSVSPSSKGSAL